MTPLETALAAAGASPSRFVATHPAPAPAATSTAALPAVAVTPARLAANLAVIEAELATPPPSRTARVLLRVGLPDATVRLVTATPGLRRSWWIAVALAVLFSLSAASSSNGAGADRIVLFLTLAPLVPLLGVALAFGPGVDPTHDLVVAAPRDSFRVFLVRAASVLTVSVVVLGLLSLVLPAGGWLRLAWLVPSLAVTAATSALATRVDARLAAAGVAAVWLVSMIVLNGTASAATAFGLVTQAVALGVTAVATVVFVAQRRRWDLVVTR